MIKENKVIGRLRGIILEKQIPQVLLEAYGVGYEVYLPMTCFSSLPDIGQETVMYTHFFVRKDAQLLFGFVHKQEQVLFRELIKINGIGPKLAMAILSGMSAQHFIRSVKYQEINILAKLPGVGKKTAERLIIEMKDRCRCLSENFAFSEAIDQPSLDSDPKREAIAALVVLGYKPQEASQMVSKVAYVGTDCEVLIRDALRAVL